MFVIRRFNHVVALPHGATRATGTPRMDSNITSKGLVEYLDAFIIGQGDAKRSLAIALIDRWRRLRISDENLRRAIVPSNILLVGPTGCGKTELARRLAKKVDAPFVKVVATKYSEVGFVGEDTASMIEELAEQAYLDESSKLKSEVNAEARVAAVEEVTTALMNSKIGIRDNLTRDTARALVESGLADTEMVEMEATMLDYAFSRSHAVGEKEYHIMDDDAPLATSRSILSTSRFSKGPNSTSHGRSSSGSHRPVWRMVTVQQAVKLIADKTAVLLLKNREHEVKDRAKLAIEERGIVFIDEFDKMISDASEEGSSFNQKRKGVEKELLTLIEGTLVPTKKLGNINTDHIVFICAGAFSSVSPKQIMPELQGRLPIRCTMKALTEADFINILETVEYSLLKTQRELLMVDNVEIEFTKCGVQEIAKYAVEMNRELVNTGARRLTTIMSIVLEEIKFNANELIGSKIVIDREFVDKRLEGVFKWGDNHAELRKFVL